MALWDWYRSIPPKTRILVGVGIMTYAVFGMAATNKIEGYIKDRKELTRLRQELDKVVPTITVVEKRDK
ncbi:hypothetical protein BCR34DRAFT_601443 [Clohesyomyces aquaticus]|uniref:Uncharacterized protein n=1 Tax=Clohesyomyces aquaticus TaxID=1231657 RepID=A0A1Y1ZM64_9PLEO|nr:hypothetical protein BCR34DRAFT_601443 [Clohesyomyces aquaticus]